MLFDRKVMIVCGALLLAACGDVGDDTNAISMAEARVSANLKDPGSAEFSNVYVVRSHVIDKNGSETVYTCGEVNARNSFGGFTGSSRFIVDQSLNAKLQTFDNIYAYFEESDPNYKFRYDPTGLDGASNFEHFYWNNYCVDAAHPPMKTGIAPD